MGLMQNCVKARNAALTKEESRLRQHQYAMKENVHRHDSVHHQVSSVISDHLDQKSLREYRIARLENQTRFWSRFGVTQSRGSRFELGMEIPPPVSILLKLYLNGVIDDRDLSSVHVEDA
jgi:hypothetical protein